MWKDFLSYGIHLDECYVLLMTFFSMAVQYFFIDAAGNCRLARTGKTAEPDSESRIARLVDQGSFTSVSSR